MVYILKHVAICINKLSFFVLLTTKGTSWLNDNSKQCTGDEITCVNLTTEVPANQEVLCPDRAICKSVTRVSDNALVRCTL